MYLGGRECSLTGNVSGLATRGTRRIGITTFRRVDRPSEVADPILPAGNAAAVPWPGALWGQFTLEVVQPHARCATHSRPFPSVMAASDRREAAGLCRVFAKTTKHRGGRQESTQILAISVLLRTNEACSEERRLAPENVTTRGLIPVSDQWRIIGCKPYLYHHTIGNDDETTLLSTG